MVALETNYDGSKIFHIQFQADGLSAAFGQDDAAFPQQSRFQKVMHDGGNCGLIQSGGFGKMDSGNGPVFVNVTEDQGFVGALQVGG